MFEAPFGAFGKPILLMVHWGAAAVCDSNFIGLWCVMAELWPKNWRKPAKNRDFWPMGCSISVSCEGAVVLLLNFSLFGSFNIWWPFWKTDRRMWGQILLLCLAHPSRHIAPWESRTDAMACLFIKPYAVEARVACLWPCKLNSKAIEMSDDSPRLARLSAWTHA